MSATWNDYDFIVQMPHMAPGEKLSEVEFLKMLAAHQWESIARALGRRPPEIENDQKERLYGSVIDVELHLGPGHTRETLGEDVRIFVKNRVRFFARKFVEGLFLISDREIPDADADRFEDRTRLRAHAGSWACMTNAFIARSGGNVRLKVFRPAGAEAVDVDALAETPLGIVEQGRVQSSGEIEGVEVAEGAIPLPDRRRERVVYPIVAESDLNGAGLVYFARYEAMMNYGERRFLCEHLERPTSTELVSCLSTEHRRAYFFANANPTESVEVDVRAFVVPPGRFTPPSGLPAYRTPLQFVFRIDLYRGSDGVLMASSLVRKSLNVPGHAKAVLAETDRFLRGLGR
jgi:probable biosynthetic protein (TIGR04098 family)